MTVTVKPANILSSKLALKQALQMDCGNDRAKMLEWLQPIIKNVQNGNLMDMDVADQLALKEVVAELNGERPENEGVDVPVSKKISPISFPNPPSHRVNAREATK